jgi:hypothetical protein
MVIEVSWIAIRAGAYEPESPRFLGPLSRHGRPQTSGHIAARTAELVGDALTDLRQASHRTQERMAKPDGRRARNVPRLERRADLLLSTLGS